MPSIGQLAEIGVGIAVTLFITAILLPPALSQIYTANTSGWNSAVVTVFETLMPVLGVLSAALVFFVYLKHGE